MLIQGTASTGKSHLIDCLRDTFLAKSTPNSSPFLLLAPTGFATFNIKALKIHSSLHIPLVSMHPLEGQPLLHFQEKLFHVKYILIDEMSLIGPKLLSHINDCLREVFPSYHNLPFEN